MMIKSRAMATVIMLVSAACVYSAGVVIEDTGFIKQRREVDGVELLRSERKIDIKSGGPVPWVLHYRYMREPDDASIQPGDLTFPRSLPWLGDRSTGTLGIGLLQRGSPWYAGGFIGVTIDGRGFRGIADEITVSEGEKGLVEFTWNEEWGVMKLRFSQEAGDDKMYAEIEVESEEELSVGLQLWARPGHLGRETLRSRWAATAARSIQGNGETHDINIDNENWILSFDANDNRRGSCAFMYLPEQMKTARVFFSGNMVRKLLEPREGKARFIFWTFLDNYRTPEQAYQYLSENAERHTESLREFEF